MKQHITTGETAQQRIEVAAEFHQVLTGADYDCASSINRPAPLHRATGLQYVDRNRGDILIVTLRRSTASCAGIQCRRQGPLHQVSLPTL
ncbi:hypothetical protein G3N57_22090 [Paraburkholderia sp. Se-20369]|nr:hypothetical protein [Paraburkholderia sp. Se-20369]